jgi:RluA family pseudouridine synthase
MVKESFEVQGVDKPTRLDKALKEQYLLWGRAAIKTILNQRKVMVNGKTVWLGSWEVKNGDRIEISDPPQEKPVEFTQFDPAWLIADLGDLIAVDKPAGLRSQATQAGGRDNLLSLAQAHFGEVALFHRLDRDASGLTLLTRPGPVNAYLDRAFKERTVEKQYLALVHGSARLEKEGVINARIGEHPKRRDMMAVVEKGGQSAETRYQALGEADGKALVLLWPVTGRTHQLRVHMAHLGAPILGDRIYWDGEGPARRLMLHARRIGLPREGDFPDREFFAPPGPDFVMEIPQQLRKYLIV